MVKTPRPLFMEIIHSNPDLKQAYMNDPVFKTIMDVMMHQGEISEEQLMKLIADICKMHRDLEEEFKQLIMRMPPQSITKG